MARIILSALMLLALWIAGGFFAFLLLPLICELPLGSGALAGLAFFIAQLLWGERFVAKLLRWQEGDERSRRLGSENCLIDAECQIALQLHGISLTRGIVEGGVTSAMLQEWLQVGLSPREARYLSSMLALPCLFRAFEAVTNSYGKLRLSEGPLWYLGRFFALIAKIVEVPLRVCWGEERPACALRDYLSEELSRCEKLPAWVRALDLLSPISLREVERQRRWSLMQGREDGDALSQCPRCGGIGTAKIIVIGVGMGTALAISPSQYWGALPLTLGIALAVCFWTRWSNWRQGVGETEVLSCVESNRRMVPVCWHGYLEKSPSNMAFEKYRFCLRGEHGVVALRRLPQSKCHGEWCEKRKSLEVRGWFSWESLDVQVEMVRVEGTSYRDRFRWKYGLWPWWLAVLGALWWALQLIGL